MSKCIVYHKLVNFALFTMAANRVKPIWKVAQDLISSLFHENAQWKKLEQTKLVRTPSSRAARRNFKVEECCTIKAELKEGFDHIFECSHVSRFWEDLAFNIKQATGIRPVAYRKQRKKEHLVTNLIQPTLEKVVYSISMIPRKPTSKQLKGTVSSHLVIQDKIKMGRASGRPPAVDATIQINEGDTCEVLIPVEIKVGIELNHLYQIAAYVTKVSTANELQKKVVIGMIIDTNNFNLVFSPYTYHDESGIELPLPIVYVSPPIVWRDSSLQGQIPFSILPAALMVIACTCYFERERLNYNQTINPQVLATAHRLLKTKHKIEPIYDDPFRALKEQQKKSKGSRRKD